MASIPSSPPACLHPLSVLDLYLSGLEQDDDETSKTPQSERKKHHRLDEILKTADFLFGAAALDGALGVLEQNCTPEGCSSNVTSLRSPRRSLYAVKASVARGRGRQQQQDSSYLCFLPNHEQQQQEVSSICYCSCRSFLEKSRNASGTETASIVCKHLLALKLMPVLGLTCQTVELSSEEEFSRAVLQRLTPQHSSRSV